jgi:hypothetical protein
MKKNKEDQIILFHRNGDSKFTFPNLAILNGLTRKEYYTFEVYVRTCKRYGVPYSNEKTFNDYMFPEGKTTFEITVIDHFHEQISHHAPIRISKEDLVYGLFSELVDKRVILVKSKFGKMKQAQVMKNKNGTFLIQSTDK